MLRGGLELLEALIAHFEGRELSCDFCVRKLRTECVGKGLVGDGCVSCIDEKQGGGEWL